MVVDLMLELDYFTMIDLQGPWFESLRGGSGCGHLTPGPGWGLTLSRNVSFLASQMTNAEGMTLAKKSSLSHKRPRPL